MVKLLSDTPKEGDRVLVLKQHWLDLLLNREKLIEVRGMPLKSGVYYLGSGGKIYGCAFFGAPLPINDAAHWNALRRKHRVPDPLPPYKRTFGLPVIRIRRISPPLPYVHPRGAIGLVRYRIA